MKEISTPTDFHKMKPHSVVFWTASIGTMIALLVTFLVLQSIQSHGFHVQPKIVNGIESNPSYFPFFVNVENTEYRCGASLISNRWDFYLQTLLPTLCVLFFLFFVGFSHLLNQKLSKFSLLFMKKVDPHSCALSRLA